MPGAADDSSSYYAQIMINQATGQMRVRLFPTNAHEPLGKLLNQQFEVTWDAYRRMKVVTEDEIHQFKQTEGELDNRRKVNFLTTTRDGRVLALMRVYDGSPFPAYAISDYPTHHEAPDTDKRVPIERRYPNLNLRKDSDFIFEAGRLAKSPEVEDVLDFQFFNFALYLSKKFGALGIAPPEFYKNGKVYIEITGRHLETYMKPRSKGGMGFKLFAKSNGDGEPMEKVPARTTFKSLGRKRGDPSGKFVLSMSVFDFVSEYYKPMQAVSAKKAYPDRF